MLRKQLLLLSLFVVTAGVAPAQETRHFTFHYGFSVKNVPSGERFRVWIPAAHSDEFQEVKPVLANGDLGLKKTHESKIREKKKYYIKVQTNRLEAGRHYHLC